MNTLAKLIASIAALIVSLTLAWIATSGLLIRDEVRLEGLPRIQLVHY